MNQGYIVQFTPHLLHNLCVGNTLVNKNLFHISMTTFNKLNFKRSLKINRTWKFDSWFQKNFLQSLCFIFSFHFQHIFCFSLVDRLIYTCSCTMFLTQSQNNLLWILCSEELKIVCFYMIMFMLKLVTLIFSVLAEKESKKMWSKFYNATSTQKLWTSCHQCLQFSKEILDVHSRTAWIISFHMQCSGRFKQNGRVKL